MSTKQCTRKYIMQSISSADREENDFYPTHPEATHRLLAKEDFSIPRRVTTIWECACGDGAISKILEERGYKVINTDIIDRGYGYYPFDFLKDTRPRDFDCIITNPPFSHALEFMRRALHVYNPWKIAFFGKLTWLEGKKYSQLFEDTHLAHVYAFRGRLPDTLLSFAWFIWERGYNGHTVVEWI